VAAAGEVLVVGAGPVGLMAACELWRRGVHARVIDCAEIPNDKSKALGVHARTMELLDSMGLADRFVAAGRPLHGMNASADGKRIVHVDFHDIDSPHPFVLSLPQSETERLLGARLAELGGRIERGVKLTALVQDADGVTVTLSSGGADQTSRLAWVIGCDGAHSTVRHALGLTFDGVPYEEPFILGDVRMTCDLPDDEASAFLSPDGVIAAFPMPEPGRWRLVGDSAIEKPSIADFERLLRDRGAPPVTIHDAVWFASFKLHRRIASKYRVGRVFVAGDAAHIHSPIGGQGMNTGMQDAFNLGWKLALVVAGAARPALLDSYEAERRPIAAATLTGTDLATKVVTLRNPVAREVRNRLATLLTSLEVVQKRVLAQASETAVGYRASPIVDEHRTPVVRATVGKRVGEGPSLSDWMDFGGAPAPGDRAPHVTIDDTCSVASLLRHARSTLLLFDGSAATPEGYANLTAIARRVRERWGTHVDSVMIVPRGDRPAELPADERVVLDTSKTLHRRYGAGSECLYLIRPDGYVGFRSQPASWQALEAHLQGILV
jgi:2-polyprenyl-6-methoxyphenol hydroxylase-like FAD-dependent oxidoreductase